MLKRPVLFLLFFCFTCKLTAGAYPGGPDSLVTFIKINDQKGRTKKLANFIKHYFTYCTADSLNPGKAKITLLLSSSGIENGKALIYFVDGLYLKRLYRMDDARKAMIKAIENVTKRDDHYLLYVLLSNLAFIQTDDGDAIGAISSYRMAKKEAVTLKDARLQTLIAIDISDIYYKYNFFGQALLYLNEAEIIHNEYRPTDEHAEVMIYYHKSDIFFRMDMPDSVWKYNEKLKQIKNEQTLKYTQIKRNGYYLCLLKGDFKQAINLINAAKTDSSCHFNNSDWQNLADAFFKSGQVDSTTSIINRLLVSPLETNHPEIKFHQYEILGEISQKKNDYKQAASYFRQALEQSEDNVNRLTQVGNILSQIKIDEIEGAYNQKNEAYKKERIWLAFAIVVAILIIIIVAMFYRAAKQKRHYEKLLFTAQKEELAFINSHEVRRHLSNILGIIDLLEHSDDKESEYKELESRLFSSAQSLDEAIKSFSEKLKD